MVWEKLTTKTMTYDSEMKLGPGSLGRPIQNLRMGQLGPGSKFELN